MGHYLAHEHRHTNRQRLSGIVWAAGLAIFLITLNQTPAQSYNSALSGRRTGSPTEPLATAPDSRVYLPFVAKPPEFSWPMAAENPQRTSYTPEQVTGSIPDGTLKVLWYRPIEAYIPQNSQIIASDGTLYIATAKGLYALDANTGDTRWRYDTELPLGNSPTIYNHVAYVGGLDGRIHALDANTGILRWAFGGGAGFASNPLVLSLNGRTTILAGNRDGKFYAIIDNGSSASLLWSYSTNGPINMSAAASAGGQTIYFASNDNFAYALNALTGQLIWKSAKLGGAGFDSYWPVVFQDKVIFSGAVPYRQGEAPGIRSPGLENVYGGYGAWSGLQQGILSRDYGFTGQLPVASLPDDPWAAGKTVVNAAAISNWLENRPWQRTTFVLNANTGSEYVFDANGNGKPEYIPIAYWGTRSGNSYPPIVGPDNTLYLGNLYDNAGPRGRVMGWKVGTTYFSLNGLEGAYDEPQAISFSGNAIYRNVCCDRVGEWQNLSGVTGQLWGYGALWSLFPGNSTDPAKVNPALQYDPMWYNQYGALERLDAYYGGSSDYIYHRSGVYNNHGDQNPFVAYQGKLFIHRSNTIIAIGPSGATAYGRRPDLRIQAPVAPAPSRARSDVQAKLESEVLKMIAAGDLRIGYYNNGQAAMDELANYFENPGDTLYTLSMAYPYLSADTQTRLLAYLKQEFASYFNPTMYTSRGWAGGPREAYPIPPEVASDMQTKPKRTSGSWADSGWLYNNIYPQFNFYALSKYAQLVPGDALTAYNLAKSKIDIPPSVADQELMDYPWRLNAYAAGYLGFLDLQKLAGMEKTDAPLRTQVDAALQHLKIVRANALTMYGPINNCASYRPNTGYALHCREMTIGRNFYYLVPELGDYLNANALSAAQNTITELTYVAPYWMEAGFNSVHQEGVKQNLYDVTVLLGKTYILKQPYTEVAKYLDAPAFAVGDLLYIQNLVAVLSAQP